MADPMNERGGPVEALIEELRTGPSRDEAFRRLFDLYAPRLVRFFSRRGFAHADCLDLTQETFVGIYRGVGGFRRDAGFETWLFRIATNAYRKRLRAGAAAKREGLEVPLDGAPEEDEGAAPAASLAAAAPTPAEELVRKERARLLREAIDRLPDQMRRCLVLRLDRELRYKEIAVLMRLSPETVKVHLAQARRRLQEELGPYFEDPFAAEEAP